MPNIEIHGLHGDERLVMLKGMIKEVVRDLDFIEDAVITTVPSTVERCAATTSAPFVRVVASRRGDAQHIAEVIHARWPALDIEYTHIDGCISR